MMGAVLLCFKIGYFYSRYGYIITGVFVTSQLCKRCNVAGEVLHIVGAPRE